MTKTSELRREREYMAYVQQILYAVISKSKSYADMQADTIRMIITEAWEELRVRPTALSPTDINQMNTEIDRFLSRKALSEDNARRYETMLLRPFFARIDFKEDGYDEYEKIVIGLYNLKNEKSETLVHDWRAPVCSLYYNSLPGRVEYESPSGIIEGDMNLKRQYGMENGRLKYYVDTEQSIDDTMLLDILSGSTSVQMKQIVATIQTEQNAAIRYDSSQVLSVVGSAGSGKTSVALHRAAYLMYQHRDQLDADSIAVLSPSSSFTEYISGVLPELGEENAKQIVLHSLVSEMIGRAVENPVDQSEKLIRGDLNGRYSGVRLKSDQAYISLLDDFTERFKSRGPAFDDLTMKRHVLAPKRELERMYREQFKTLTPAQRLIRIQTIVEDRLSEWEKTLLPQYKDQFFERYRGKELDFISQMAVSQQLHPIRGQIKQMLIINPLALYAEAMAGMDKNLATVAQENAEAGTVYWEDAPGIAYMMLKLGFVKPDTSIKHLLIDEAQDYPEISLKLIKLYFTRARFTILGDPNQRTLPGLPPCRPSRWGELMGESEAPLLRLSRVYRSTTEITEFCNGILQNRDAPIPFGRHGDQPVWGAYSDEALVNAVNGWSEAGYRSIAVITRGKSETNKVKKLFKGANVLTDNDDEIGRMEGVTVAGYHFLKGLEFDAVAVVWPDIELADDERRRLYTACSRALHQLALFQRVANES